MEDLIILSPHLCGETYYNEWQNWIVGNKAIGLKSIPCSWTPPFIVITTLAHKRWKKDRESNIAIQTNTVHWLVTDAGLSDHIHRICNGLTEFLIVRSSAPLETLRERGQYESKKCKGTVENVLSAIYHVWTHAESLTPSLESKISDEISLVVQAYIRTLAAGHLSNERRVSRKITEWVCELERPTIKDTANILRFTVKKVGNLIPQNDLLCETKQQLYEKIKEIAAINSNLGKRCHLEWVWDGHKLWIVQRDKEDDHKGVSPKNRRTVNFIDVKPHSLIDFVEEPQSTKSWPKIECIRTFRACSLPFARVYLLENPDILKQLTNHTLSDNLLNDLKWLLKLPIVIRTDVKESTDFSPILLPRTDTIKDINDSIDFMQKTALKFQKNGLEFDDFCFIIHRFIHSISCAYSISWPDISRVRIDSTWGLPDGLLFYPHDSFEVDSQNPKNIKRQIRCKTEYLEIDDSGKWVERRCGRPWDWKSSLEFSELNEIAQFSCLISEYLKSPVQIMYFVDVDPATCHSQCLPWYYTTKALPKIPQEASESRLAGKRVVISNEWDLSMLIKRIEEREMTDTINILLKPRPELLRSRNFIMKLVNILSNKKFPIELEGSVLSHIYYILSSQGMRIKCIDAFEPKLKRRSFGKLIRDLIPVHIKSHGETVQIYKLTEDELLPLLKAKVVEEALELYWESDPSKVFEELTDILEVVESTCRFFGRNFEDLRSAAEKKRKQKGGFKDGLVLVETHEVPLIRHELTQTSFWDTDESEAKITISSNSKKNVRKPKTRGKNLIIPLIPPDPTVCYGQFAIPLGDGDQEAVINYKEKEVFVSIRPIIKHHIDPNQLSLFPINRS